MKGQILLHNIHHNDNKNETKTKTSLYNYQTQRRSQIEKLLRCESNVF